VSLITETVDRKVQPNRTKTDPIPTTNPNPNPNCMKLQKCKATE